MPDCITWGAKMPCPPCAEALRTAAALAYQREQINKEWRAKMRAAREMHATKVAKSCGCETCEKILARFAIREQT